MATVLGTVDQYEFINDVMDVVLGTVDQHEFINDVINELEIHVEPFILLEPNVEEDATLECNHVLSEKLFESLFESLKLDLLNLLTRKVASATEYINPNKK